jgi:hypothetical protein
MARSRKIPIFTPRINPALHRRAAEAKILGRILLAFGELEYMIANGADVATDQGDSVKRALYRLRNTQGRIDAADAFMRSKFAAAGLARDYETMMSAVRYCLKIRNQYAHCNWGDDQSLAKGGLFFADLREAAGATDGWEHQWKHVSPRLLRDQEAYFVYAQDWLFHLEPERLLRAGRLSRNPFPAPLERERPPLHNPPLKHIPPWLSEDQKALHIARGQAAEGGAPTPTRAHLEMEARREAARAKRQADRARAKAKHSPKPEAPDRT